LVAVVNETFVRRYFDGDNPVGYRITFGPNRIGPEIIGVVKDTKNISLREDALPTYYISYLQNEMRGMTYQIRTADDPSRIIAAVRRAAREIDPTLPLFDIKTLAAQVDGSLVRERLIGTLSGFFALLSLLLAAVGLYGAMAYAVNQRTQEIGIRMALGAQRSDVLRMVVMQGMKLVLVGAVLGLAVSFATTHLIASYLYGVTPTDPVTFIGVPLLLLIVASIACIIPARRATRVDPLVALRYE
jgi:predicted permease